MHTFKNCDLEKIPLPKVHQDNLSTLYPVLSTQYLVPSTPNPLIPQRLIRLQHVLNAFQRLLFAAKAEEGFSFDIQ